jgi:hypothetical protein
MEVKMKLLLRRLERLEKRAAPVVNHTTVQAASIIRERRRKRVAALGEVEEELPWSTFSLRPECRFSIAETLRFGRQMAHERNVTWSAGQEHQTE